MTLIKKKEKTGILVYFNPASNVSSLYVDFLFDLNVYGRSQGDEVAAIFEAHGTCSYDFRYFQVRYVCTGVNKYSLDSSASSLLRLNRPFLGEKESCYPISKKARSAGNEVVNKYNRQHLQSCSLNMRLFTNFSGFKEPFHG